MSAADDLRIEHVAADGTVTVLKQSVPVQEGEVVDGTFMSGAALDRFLTEQIDAAREAGVLFSLHMKATMMKVSDPIIFGHGVVAYFASIFDKYGDVLEAAGADPANGWNQVLTVVDGLDDETRSAIHADIEAAYADGPDLAMVDSDRGITNLHVPSDVIIDASMPAMIRNGGQMWDADGETRDTLAVIPDSQLRRRVSGRDRGLQGERCLRPIDDGHGPQCRVDGAEGRGVRQPRQDLRDRRGRHRARRRPGWRQPLLDFEVDAGDIWRMCNVRDLPIQDWVKLAVTRARATGAPAVFWLDAERGHDAELIKKVDRYLGDHDTDGLEIHVMAPTEATRFSVERIRQGLDTISVTGNVLRDYNTDLFPILELGTSAKMLSIVPLMNGGGLFETGAGGSAPKHVQQFEKENYLRWDSLGEFLALAVSLEHLGEVTGNPKAKVLADALDAATGKLLQENKSPARRLGSIDNRGSHAYLAQYWAEALAAQTDDTDLAVTFAPVAARFAEHEAQINDELIGAQGHPNDLGGYFMPEADLVSGRDAAQPRP